MFTSDRARRGNTRRPDGQRNDSSRCCSISPIDGGFKRFNCACVRICETRINKRTDGQINGHAFGDGLICGSGKCGRNVFDGCGSGAVGDIPSGIDQLNRHVIGSVVTVDMRTFDRAAAVCKDDSSSCRR